MNLSIDVKKESNLIVPDFNEKIKFNALSETTAGYLNNGFIKVVYLNDYLSNNSDFAADSLRDKLNQVYIQEKSKYTGDELFWSIVNILSPKSGQIYQTTVIILMAKYFETCDIFEEPMEEAEE